MNRKHIAKQQKLLELSMQIKPDLIMHDLYIQVHPKDLAISPIPTQSTPETNINFLRAHEFLFIAKRNNFSTQYPPQKKQNKNIKKIEKLTGISVVKHSFIKRLILRAASLFMMQQACINDSLAIALESVLEYIKHQKQTHENLSQEITQLKKEVFKLELAIKKQKHAFNLQLYNRK